MLMVRPVNFTSGESTVRLIPARLETSRSAAALAGGGESGNQRSIRLFNSLFSYIMTKYLCDSLKKGWLAKVSYFTANLDQRSLCPALSRERTTPNSSSFRPWRVVRGLQVSLPNFTATVQCLSLCPGSFTYDRNVRGLAQRLMKECNALVEPKRSNKVVCYDRNESFY